MILDNENLELLQNTAEEDCTKDAKTLISDYRAKNCDKVIIATLNLNSLPNKFSSLAEIISNNIDILVIEETKIDESFPEGQFLIPGYKKPYRKDRNRNGGGIIVYVREDIPSRKLDQFMLDDDIEGIFIEINLRKSKWLMLATYRPPSSSKSQYLNSIGNAVDFYSKTYKNVVLLGDFNITESEEEMHDFLEDYDLSNLVHFPTCFKNAENPREIDLIITNRVSSFQNTIGISTGLSDFHKMVVTTMKSKFPKMPPKVITYRDMKKFDKDDFREDLEEELKNMESNSYKDFETAFSRALDKHAPEKKKSVRANSKHYVSKAMPVAIMKRSELSSRYRKDPSDANSLAFKKQRNFCSRLYKIERKKYYESLNLSDITDNKKFWKTMKPFLSSKTAFSQKISLKEGDKIISDDTEVANVLNKNFVEAVRLLSDKGGCSNNVLNFNTIDDPLENIIQRFKNHPSIIAIKEKVVSGSFDFKPLTVEEVSTEIFKMNKKSQLPE